MKRCPQCDFIYENEQGLCDMDGSVLVPDQTASLVAGDVSPHDRLERVRWEPPPGSRRKSRWMSLAVLPVGGVALGAALFTVSDVLTHRAPAETQAATTQESARTSDAAPESAEVTASETPAPLEDAADTTDATDAEAAPSVSHTRSAITRVSAKGRAQASAANETTSARAPAQAATPKREEKRLRPEGAKKESKLGSILKKTGRALKKPFGF